MKHQASNTKSQISTNTPNRQTVYDLEQRSLDFAKSVREFVKQLPRSISNSEDTKQLVRSSGSIGANYIEANESLSKKDFVMRVKISRKEAKETVYWLQLIECSENQLDEWREIVKEATELKKILSAILRRSEQ